MVSTEYSEAIVEVLDILQYSDNTIKEKIPKKLIEFWEENKSTTYKPNIDHNKTIDEMNLKDKTKSIITMIYINYLCDSEEKEKLNLILKENEKKYQQELMEKYNPDNIFKKKNENKNVEQKPEETAISVVQKEKWYKKIFSIIKGLFNRK